MNNQYKKLSAFKNYGHTFIKLFAYNLITVVSIVELMA